MELLKGRPESEKGRLEKEIRVYDLLDELGIPFMRVDHSPLETMEDCIEVDKILDAHVCKNLFLVNSNQSQYYLLMVTGDKKLETKKISKQIGSSRLSFGKAKNMEEFLDISPGAVSVMGLMNDKDLKVQLLIDEDIIHHEYLGCHPCVNTSSIKLKTSDVLDIFLKKVDHEPVMVQID
ncbi:MAG TPA: prolyl-tRNA synthetase associated domain-containing protein [Candidatus Merdenecus merdavium]|nr:prolyl-tRNA synthetase associated domain-containing protein [Candidatus Merdenecus merdavium]